MAIIVGKQGEQPFSITDQHVSRKHLKLTPLEDGNVLVEDLSSANGTYIDGVQIRKMKVSPDTIVRMGSSFTFRVSDAFRPAVPPTPPVPPTPVPPSPGPGPTPVKTVSIDHLQYVWNKHQQDVINLQKRNASNNFLSMLPMFILAGLGYLVSCLPDLAEFRLALTVAGFGLGCIIKWISYKSTTNQPQQMAKLNNQFQIDYVCPKCKRFLGFIPFEGIKNQKQCPCCKTKWE